MKKINKTAFVVLALLALCWGCTPENVGPKDDANGNRGIAGAIGDPQPALDPVCGNAVTYALVSEDGSTTINKCFGPDAAGNPLVSCGGAQPAWGTVTIMNGLTDVVANITLADNWFAASEYNRFAPAASFTFDANGFPVMNQDWTARVINPVVGKWQVARSLNETGNVFAFGTKITVVQLTAMGEVIPASVTTLWLKDLTAPTTAASPYLANWTRNVCTVWPAAQNVCKPVYVGVPQLTGCTQLAPSVTSTGGPLTYAWSTGATSASLNVCPTTNGAYTVSVSDNNGPRAVLNYDVHVVNVACGPQNNQVRICHYPPGNPSRGSEQCVTWSAVASHVAEYRSNGQGGHNSGCKLGSCNNPCN